MSEEHAKAVVALAPDEGSSYPKRTFTAVQPIIAEDALCAQPSMPSAWTTCPRALKVNDMASDYFDRVYRTTEQNAVQDLYDDWAETYDADLIENGYVTPDRCAAALATHLPARDLPILDFACGTGLSGAAIAAQGFTLIDGVDLSEAMLNAARKRGVYRNLFKANPDQPPSAAPGDYAAIAAVGAISPGAAPATFFDALLSCLAPGGLFVLSYNDHALADPEHTSRLRRALDDGIVRERFREHGDHVVNLGSKSTVYVLEKLNRS